MKRVVTTALSVVITAGSTGSALAQFQSPSSKSPTRVKEVEQVGFFGKSRRSCKDCEDVIIIPAEPEAKAVTPIPSTTPAPAAPAPQAPVAPTLPAPAPEAPADLPADPFAGAFDVASADTTLAPNMLGDFAGTVFQGNPTPVNQGLTPAENARVRTITRYKVADFNSPLPKTRVLYDFNYFGDAFQAGGKVYRNFAGAEYAFLGNMMSVEVRGSLNTFNDFDNATDTTEFGDLRSVFKAVFFQNQNTVLTTGLGMNWPTGGVPEGVPGVYAVTPFVGYLFMSPNSPLFVQGFQQVDFPFHAADQVLMHTDVGVGYWLRRYDPSRFVSGIAPSLELHLYTPIGDSPSGDLLGLRYNDVLNMTLGSTFFVGRNLQFAIGLGIPVTEIKDYDIEAQFHGEWRFGGNGNGTGSGLRAAPNLF